MRSCSPQHYELFFEPNLSSFTFTGREKIRVQVEKPTKTLIMHAAELAIVHAEVLHEGTSLVATVKLDEKKEELTLALPKVVSGSIDVCLEFSGTLNDRLIGFYRSEYQVGGKKKIMLSTQFEAADARRAFPCWDEPDAKATFTVSLSVDKGLTALSNMPVASTKVLGKKSLYTFAQTPVMSTYLLYLGVGEFDSIGGSLGGIKIRIITTKGKKSQAAYALEMTKTFLAYYQNYFGIPYPLPKLDMIAVPDFASGAMENWGAITFRETALLFDQKTSSLATKQRVAEVIAHELAHQWFGNLVTMKWWNNLWLNESFATFMATKAVDAIYPEWEYWDQFVGGAVSQAFDLDALKTSHPIEVDVKDPSEIREIFDEISYQKGGSVLRMLEQFLGEEVFQAGLSSYLGAHKYANATTEDLWDALGEASSKPVRTLMNTWVKVIGYPILDTVVKNGRVQFTQRRFLLEGHPTPGNWMIPLSLETAEGTTRHIMDKKVFALPLKGDWFKANALQTGLYRVAYATPQLQALAPRIAEKSLSVYDRWGIHEDLFARCMSGEVGLAQYLEFLDAYGKEDAFMVIDNIAQSLYTSYLFLFDDPPSPTIKKHGLRFYKQVYARLGWDARPQEKPSDVLLRSFILTALGRLDDTWTLAEARTRFNQFLAKPASLDPNLRAAVYTLVAWGGTDATFDQLVDQYKKADSQEEKNRFLSALAGFKDPRLLQRALDFSLSPDVRSQDLPIAILRVAGNPYGKPLVWPWVQKNWLEICKRFGVGSPLINRVVASLSVVADKSKEKEIAAFFKKHPMPGTERKLAQTLELLRINAAFRERAKKEFGRGKNK